MQKLRWTLVAVVALGRVAHAGTPAGSADPQPAPTDPQPAPAPIQPQHIDAAGVADAAEVVQVTGSMSVRGVVDDYMVLPSGSELTGQLKLITADALLTGQPASLGDLALFELAGRHAFSGHVEVAGAVDLLPKQPTTTDEKAWQSASGGVRIKLARYVALAIGGAGGHLFDHDGEWLRQTAMIDVKHPLNRYVAFDIQGGADGIELAAPGASGAHLTELAVQASTFFRADEVAGAWAGVGYAIPVVQSGVDPTTQMAIDPKPRLDLAIGAVLAVVPEWDLFVSYAVITRGDVQDRASMLPILDGGFNQHQLVVGVTRHFEGGKKHSIAEPLEM